MRGGFGRGVVVGAATTTVVLMTATALAGTGVGGVFNLGQVNSVNATTTLTGARAGKMLQVTNTSAGAGATGIGITVPAGKPPLTVNSSKRVDHLNADMVDGVDADGFFRKGSSAGGALKGNYPNPGLRAPEASHVVGTAGEPVFPSGWHQFPSFAVVQAGFYKDPFGIVHLQGVVQCTPTGPEMCTPGFYERIFTLPAGYRPAANVEFPVESNLSFGAIVVKGGGGDDDGHVVVQAGQPQAYVALDGITFRAA